MSNVNFDLLDSSVEDLAELEAFEPFPPGTYRVTLDFSEKEVNDKPSVEFGFKCQEVIELSEATATPPEVGKTGSILYSLYKADGEVNSIGQGQLRDLLSTLRESVGGDTSREVMANAKGVSAVVTLKVRQDNKDKDKKYNALSAIIVD